MEYLLRLLGMCCLNLGWVRPVFLLSLPGLELFLYVHSSGKSPEGKRVRGVGVTEGKEGTRATYIHPAQACRLG